MTTFRASDPGETVFQVSTSHIGVNHFADHGSKIPILFLELFAIVPLEVLIVSIQNIPQGGLLRFSWVINAKNRHNKAKWKLTYTEKEDIYSLY